MRNFPVLALVLLFSFSSAGCLCAPNDSTVPFTDDSKDENSDFEQCLEVHAIHAKASINVSEGAASAILSTFNQCGFGVNIDPGKISVYESDDQENWRLIDADFQVVGDGGLDINCAVTMDYSGSMEYYIDGLESAVSDFVELKRKHDEMEIIKFSSDVEVVQAFTSDYEILKEAVAESWQGEGNWTFLYDSIGMAVETTGARPFPRVAIAFTDGHEEHDVLDQPLYDLNSAIARAKQYGIPVYTIGLGYVDEQALEKIADTTGGWSYITPSVSDLKQIYETISEALELSVVISWTPTVESGKVYARFDVGYNADGEELTDSIIVSYEL
jgi:hypothetical protein